MPEESVCPNCDSPSVVYADTEEGDGHMVCRRRGTFRVVKFGGWWNRAPRRFGQWVLAGYARDVRRIHSADCQS
jgi:hypothetical protein